jgi:hypothetical protein
MRRLVTTALTSAGRRAGRVRSAWREFWFTPADPTPLAVMRILFGGMLLYTHIVWGLNLEGFFGPSGWQGEALVRTFQQGQLAWSFWWWVPGNLHFTVHLVCLGILTLYMLGVFTPATSILAYLITVSYSYRAPLANFGLDQMNAIAALYLAIGPSGAVLSVDRLWQRYRRGRAARRGEGANLVETVAPTARANLALRLMQVHLCVIYIFACHSKLLGESWWNGQAIWQAVSNLEYQSADLTGLAWYPWLVNLLTHVTVVWEMTFWALVWRPLCRPVVLLIGVAIHLGIGAFMGMWTFGLAVIFMYVCFVPGTTINAVLGTLTRFFRKVSIPEPALAAKLDKARPVDVPVTLALTIDEPVASDEPAHADQKRPFDVPIDTARRAPTAPRPLPLGRRPSVVLVESRLKRQAQIQEYLVNRGFRCFVASDLHQARSLLSVVDIDAIVVTTTWFSDEDVRAFRDALISGGPALPASLFFLPGGNQTESGDFQNYDRHRVARRSMSLRELRLVVLEILGEPGQTPPAPVPRAVHSSNGNGHKPSVAPTDQDAAEGPAEDSTADLEVPANPNGAKT